MFVDGYTKAPVPYDEREVKKKLWKSDPWDDAMPSAKGFLSDFVYSLRGTSVPTAFALWTAVLTIASAVKREAWLEWYPKPLYGNMYLLLVSPPRINKKTSCISVGEDLLKRFPAYIKNHNKRLIKRLKVIRNKATKEYIVSSMLPSKNGKSASSLLHEVDEQGNSLQTVMIGDDGRPLKYEHTSEAVIIAPELGVMVSKDKYNEGLLQFLLDVYDTHDTWEAGTETKGLRRLKKLYTTFIGGTTPEAMRTSIPSSVYGDGFLSRTAAVWLESPVRRVPEPFRIESAPSMNELARRLAWIAENNFGEFRLADDTREYYHLWYDKYMQSLEDDPQSSGVRAGMDVNLLKMSMWMHAQRYATDMVISLQDIKDGQLLLERTFGGTFEMLNLMRGGGHYTAYKYIADYIIAHPGVTHVALQRNTPKKINSKILLDVITEMKNRGEVEIREDAKNRLTMRKYTWKAGTRSRRLKKQIQEGLEDTAIVELPKVVAQRRK